MMHESVLYASSDGVAGTDSNGRFLPLKHTEQKLLMIPYYWDPLGLAYVVAQQAAAGLGGGGASTIADGADVAEGAKADAAWSGAGAGSVIAILKASYARLVAGLAVTGTFWQATQPVSIATTVTTDPSDRATRLLGHVTVDSSVLPTGAAKEIGGNLDALVIGQASQSTAARQDLALTALTALDTDLKAEVGALSGTPGAYTVLDRLNVLGQKIDAAAKLAATDATLKQLIVAVKPTPGVAGRATLLHR